jgi:hypothetical protein
MRDISNNLKLYRSEILKSLDIEQPHFAANVETGLKPLLRVIISRKFRSPGLTAPSIWEARHSASPASPPAISPH